MQVKIFGLPISLSEKEFTLISKLSEGLNDELNKFLIPAKKKFETLKIALLLSNKESKDAFRIIDFPKKPQFDEVESKYLSLRIGLSKLAENYIRETSEVKSIQIVLAYDMEFESLKIEGMQNRPAGASLDQDDLGEFFVTEPKFTLNQMVLNEELEKEIKTALIAISHTKKIYDEWGFNEIDQIPKAILNFYGPPGTGKTMAANAIASFNNSKILALNYAEIESKYVGDAPKKLMKAFEEAFKEKAVLFFDEADSFLGKRITNVSSSSDQAINSLRSQLLILLENFEGIVIFATNLVKNYDKAFESRILKHLKFDLPDEKLRRRLIETMIPSKLPLTELFNEDQYNELVTLSDGLAGRQIKNAILDTLTTAAYYNEDTVSYVYFKNAFESMKEKNEKMTQEGSKPPLPPAVKEALEAKIKESLAKKNDDESIVADTQTCIEEQPNLVKQI